MDMIKITMNGISSYYYTEKDHLKIIAFAEAINSTAGTDVKIKITKVLEAYVPKSIQLDDVYLRYFNLQDIYGSKDSKVSDYTTNRIAEECAFNEQYCDFVGDLAVSLTTVECTAYIGKAIADTVLIKALEILDNHKNHINKCFYEFNKSVVKHYDFNEEKSVDRACGKANVAIGMEVNPNAAIGTESWEIPNEAPKTKKVPMPNKTSNN